jgi:hypothetical protein
MKNFLIILNILTYWPAFFAYTLIYGTIAQYFGFSHLGTVILMALIPISFFIRIPFK